MSALLHPAVTCRRAVRAYYWRSKMGRASCTTCSTRERVALDQATPRELTRRPRREFARYQFQVKAEIEWESRTAWGSVTDVSRSGLFIEMPQAPCMGAHFTAQLALNEPLRLNGVVRRVVHGIGIGVDLEVPEESRNRFQALLLALSAGADPTTTAMKVPQEETIAKAAAGRV
jgi:hypothetical protein